MSNPINAGGSSSNLEPSRFLPQSDMNAGPMFPGYKITASTTASAIIAVMVIHSQIG